MQRKVLKILEQAARGVQQTALAHSMAGVAAVSVGCLLQLPCPAGYLAVELSGCRLANWLSRCGDPLLTHARRRLRRLQSMHAVVGACSAWDPGPGGGGGGGGGGS